MKRLAYNRPMGVEIRNRVPKVAIIQALRFHFNMRTVAIANIVKCSPQDVSHVTVCESFRGIPWELRRRQKEAIEAARRYIS